MESHVREMPHHFDSESSAAEVQKPRNSYLIAQGLVGLVANIVGEDYASLLADIRRYKGHVAGLCSGPSNEDGRRRLHNPELKTTYVASSIAALRAMSLKYRREVVSQIPAIMELALKLEQAELHLVEALQVEALMKADRSHYEETGLFPAVADAADVLFQKHRVTHWHWSAASDDQLGRIAAILCERIEE
jgi:hypothetical protein